MGTDIHMNIEVRSAGKWRFIGAGYNDRNYDAFGVLANVRNGTWGRKTAVIASPRGLPDDLASNPDDLGDHSFSWLTLAELLAFDWDTNVCNHEALVDCATFRAWDGKTAPREYCARTNREVIDQDDVMNISPDGKHVRVRWSSPLKVAVGNLHAEFIPRLVDIAEKNGVPPDDVRIVFGFDS